MTLEQFQRELAQFVHDKEINKDVSATYIDKYSRTIFFMLSQLGHIDAAEKIRYKPHHASTIQQLEHGFAEGETATIYKDLDKVAKKRTWSVYIYFLKVLSEYQNTINGDTEEFAEIKRILDIGIGFWNDSRGNIKHLGSLISLLNDWLESPKTGDTEKLTRVLEAFIFVANVFFIKLDKLDKPESEIPWYDAKTKLAIHLLKKTGRSALELKGELVKLLLLTKRQFVMLPEDIEETAPVVERRFKRVIEKQLTALSTLGLIEKHQQLQEKYQVLAKLANYFFTLGKSVKDKEFWQLFSYDELGSCLRMLGFEDLEIEKFKATHQSFHSHFYSSWWYGSWHYKNGLSLVFGSKAIDDRLKSAIGFAAAEQKDAALTPQVASSISPSLSTSSFEDEFIESVDGSELSGVVSKEVDALAELAVVFQQLNGDKPPYLSGYHQAFHSLSTLYGLMDEELLELRSLDLHELNDTDYDFLDEQDVILSGQDLQEKLQQSFKVLDQLVVKLYILSFWIERYEKIQKEIDVLKRQRTLGLDLSEIETYYIEGIKAIIKTAGPLINLESLGLQNIDEINSYRQIKDLYQNAEPVIKDTVKGFLTFVGKRRETTYTMVNVLNRNTDKEMLQSLKSYIQLAPWYSPSGIWERLLRLLSPTYRRCISQIEAHIIEHEINEQLQAEQSMVADEGTYEPSRSEVEEDGSVYLNIDQTLKTEKAQASNRFSKSAINGLSRSLSRFGVLKEPRDSLKRRRSTDGQDLVPHQEPYCKVLLDSAEVISALPHHDEVSATPVISVMA